MATELLVFVMSIVGLICFMNRWKSKTLNQFSGPRGLPFVGNGFQLDFNNLHKSFGEWANIYGGVYKVNLFGQAVLVVSSEDAMREILVSKGKYFAGRVVSERSRIAKVIKAMPYLQLTTELRDLRKSCHQTLKMYDTGLERLEELGQDIIQEAVDDIKEIRGEEFDLKPILYKATMNFMMQLLVGKKYSHEDELTKMIQEMEQLFIHVFKGSTDALLLDNIPFAKYLPICQHIYTNVKKFGNSFWNVVEKVNLESDENGENSGVATLNELMTASPNISEEAARSVAVALLLGGVTTTTTLTYSLINILIHNPAIYDKVQSELQTKLGNKMVSLKDKENLPYMMATMYEALRYCSINPYLLPHVSATATTLQGKPVPAGILIFPNVVTLHHDQEIYPDPWQFKPERFLDKDGKLVPADHRALRNVYAFGAGPRVCPGETLAKNRFFLLAASILREFRFQAGLNLVTCDPRDYLSGVPLKQKPFTVTL